MAIIREARRTTATINETYDIPKQEVHFPWVMLLICLLVDVIDIILTLTAVGIIPWWIFTFFVFTPILMLYLNSREKKFSPKSIKTDLEKKHNLSSLKESSKLTRESKALAKAGQTAAAMEKAEMAARASSKLPRAFKWAGVLTENIPLLEFLPINSALLVMSYFDNKNSVQKTQDTMKEMASNPTFKVIQGGLSSSSSPQSQKSDNRKAA